MTTTDSMRDELGMALGWTKEGPPQWRGTLWKPPGWPNCTKSVEGDAYFLRTLDSLAAIWREELKGWEWRRYEVLHDGNAPYRGLKTLWFGSCAEKMLYVNVPDTGDELHDRTALTLAAWKAKKGLR